MTNYEIKSDIDSQIAELNRRTFLFFIKSNRIKNINDIQKIEERIFFAKRGYLIYLFISVLCGGFLYIAGLSQIFSFNLIDLTKSGLLIILTIGNIGNAWNHKIDYERLKMIRYLHELKDKIK